MIAVVALVVVAVCAVPAAPAMGSVIAEDGPHAASQIRSSHSIGVGIGRADAGQRSEERTQGPGPGWWRSGSSSRTADALRPIGARRGSELDPGIAEPIPSRVETCAPDLSARETSDTRPGPAGPENVKTPPAEEATTTGPAFADHGMSLPDPIAAESVATTYGVVGGSQAYVMRRISDERPVASDPDATEAGGADVSPRNASGAATSHGIDVEGAHQQPRRTAVPKRVVHRADSEVAEFDGSPWAERWLCTSVPALQDTTRLRPTRQLLTSIAGYSDGAGSASPVVDT
jgi:hypothetical protein